jgi:hypothetical protein
MAALHAPADALVTMSVRDSTFCAAVWRRRGREATGFHVFVHTQSWAVLLNHGRFYRRSSYRCDSRINSDVCV